MDFRCFRASYISLLFEFKGISERSPIKFHASNINSDLYSSFFRGGPLFLKRLYHSGRGPVLNDAFGSNVWLVKRLPKFIVGSKLFRSYF